eukprot:TRINITY_DN5100_c0_g1_i4.p1 TRINITY_DN5100_c0_g1~~TRINITY_DN5100_c0_g1_i4.p1  ORF type:complete len:391 (-),score=65.99 TRINITY_DN5100_c0_g1_i4:1091-2182(-)
MADDKRSAQVEERMSSLQNSHAALRETSEQHSALLADVLQRLDQLRAAYKEPDGSSVNSKGPMGNSFGTDGGIHTRTMKLDFPRFDESNPSGWLFKAKQYFAYHNALPEQWLTIASLNMEGDALKWYQWYINYKPEASWKEFVDAMDARFALTRSEDFAGKLSKLRQTSTVLEYQKEFQKLSNRVKGLSEKYLISVYLSGLKDEIRIGVQKLRPPTLPEAFTLSQLQEEEVSVKLKMLRSEVGRPRFSTHFNDAKPSVSTVLEIKRLTPSEARERRAKGLCYKCDEQFVPGHRCKNQKFFWIEGLLDDAEDDDDHQPSTQDVSKEEEAAPQISLHAIAGLRATQTMCISGGPPPDELVLSSAI